MERARELLAAEIGKPVECVDRVYVTAALRAIEASYRLGIEEAAKAVRGFMPARLSDAIPFADRAINGLKLSATIAANKGASAMRAEMRLPNGETILCSFGYIDESAGILPRLMKVLADEQTVQQPRRRRATAILNLRTE